MTAFAVEIGSGEPGMKKADLFVVSAGTAADAKAICKDRFSGVAEEAWDSATVTTIADVASSAALALVGYTFNVVVRAPTTEAILESVSFTATSTDNTLDEIAAALVVLLNATSSIAAASESSNVLTVAAISDGIGDHSLTMEVLPPVLTDASGIQENRRTAIPGYTGAIVHEGIAGAVLTVDFAVDAYAVPTIYTTILKR